MIDRSVGCHIGQCEGFQLTPDQAVEHFAAREDAMTLGPLMDVALLQAHAPYTLAGIAIFRAALDYAGIIGEKLRRSALARTASVASREPGPGGRVSA